MAAALFGALGLPGVAHARDAAAPAPISAAAAPDSAAAAPDSAAAAPISAAPAATSPPVDASAPVTPGIDVPKQGDPRDVTLTRPRGKPWLIAGEAQYRSLLVTDEDPANDRYLLYRAQGTYYPLPWLSVFARLGLNQRFVSVQGESGLRMDDLALGAAAEQTVSLARLGWQRTLGLSHSLRVYLPTSFESHEQNLYFATEWSTRARLHLIDELFAGIRGTLHYRFNEYAEQAGPQGGTLPRLVVELRPFVEYSPFVSDKWGTITVGADLHGDETIDYPSRDPANIPESELPPGTLTGSSLSGSGSSDSFVTPHYGYDLYASYTPPIPHFSFILSLEQAGNVVRYGEPRLFFIHRDQTELALHAVATY
jgi:hypothetical protein